MVVEPYASAQCYIYWKGHNNPDHPKNSRVFYKYVKTGWFSRVLYVWRPKAGDWQLSHHKKIPWHLGLQDRMIKISDEEREALQAEEQMSPEDKAWAEEQRQYVAKAAARRQQMLDKDRTLREALNNNKSSEIIDALIARNRQK